MRKTVQITDKIKKEFPNLCLSKDIITLLEKYLDLLQQWNQKMNLTAIRDKESMIVKLILDSIVAISESHSREIINESSKIMDIGSGAGIPGIILAICNPELRLVSIDKAKKKIAFQEHLVRTLDLKNVNPISVRLEDLVNNPDHRLTYDVIISRAFDQIKNILNFADQFLRKEGHLILWKGEKWQEEFSEVKESIQQHYRIQHTSPYGFGDMDHGGILVIIQKLN